MSETLESEFGVIWVRHEAYGWHWYDWDALTQTCTDMTETPKNFFACFSILHIWDWDTLKNNDDKDLRRLSHICASLGQGVSVISMSNVSLVSHSYDMSHITPNSGLSVSIISVSRVDFTSHSYRSQLDWFDALILGTPLYFQLRLRYLIRKLDG